MPLLLDMPEGDTFVVPLPSSHLPSELTTMNLYGMRVERPVHKLIVEEAIARGNDVKERGFGHVVAKSQSNNNDNNDSSLVGAVGCVAEVLIQTPEQSAPLGQQDAGVSQSASGDGESPAVVVLCRGCYRFQVREIVKTIPYTVAIVDEIADDDDGRDNESDDKDDKNNNEDNADGLLDDMYISLSVSELLPRVMKGCKAFLDQRVRDQEKTKSPLELAILEQSGLPPSPDRSQVEEAMAVFDVFQSSLIDICSTPLERNYAIAMMAAELCNADNEVRKALISTRNSVTRLRLVCQQVERAVSTNQARAIANDIVTPGTNQDNNSDGDNGNSSNNNDTFDDERDLMIGPPVLPPWASQISKGVRIEYFWNEDLEWCAGTVVDDPMRIMDEIVLTVRFDDGEVHRLPLNPDEKLRWRPGSAPN